MKLFIWFFLDPSTFSLKTRDPSDRFVVQMWRGKGWWGVTEVGTLRCKVPPKVPEEVTKGKGEDFFILFLSFVFTTLCPFLLPPYFRTFLSSFLPSSLPSFVKKGPSFCKLTKYFELGLFPFNSQFLDSLLLRFVVLSYHGSPIQITFRFL